MMTYATKTKDNVKKFAEVFTPAGVAFEMVLQESLRPLLRDVDKTFFDPSVGEGQFPCTELVLKLFFNVERLNEDLALRALKSLHGVDIQASSVETARNHLIQTLTDSYRYFTGKEFTRLDEARAIVNENIFVGDFLKLAEKWSNPQLSLF